MTFLTMLFGCVEPYETESIEYQKIMVVDGVITDQEGPHYINLSYTTPIDTNYLNPVSGADVSVQIGDGEVIFFEENESGLYESPASFAGIPGQKYTLHIETTEGKMYLSNPETLIASPEIDSIYDRFAELPDADANRAVPGIQFFVDSHDESGQARFFRYQSNETYQIIPTYPSRFGPDSTGRLNARQEYNDIATCYRSGENNELIIQSSVGSSVNRVSEVPVRYINNLTPILRNRYSIEVTQYAITEGAFNYYRKLKQSIEEAGSLFDRQQGTITGNIQSVDNPSEPVLGYFEVSGTSKLRAFFNARDFDRRFTRPDNFYLCTSDEILDTNTPIVWGEDTLSIAIFLNPELDTGNIVKDTYYIINWDPGVGFMSIGPKWCTACNYYASTERPDFWPLRFF